jgi:hypothetical protein
MITARRLLVELCCIERTRRETAMRQQAQRYPENHPCHHTAQLKSRLQDLSQHIREDIRKIDDRKAQALLETSAEVIDGLVTALDHYERSAEPAFQ